MYMILGRGIPVKPVFPVMPVAPVRPAVIRKTESWVCISHGSIILVCGMILATKVHKALDGKRKIMRRSERKTPV